MVYGLWVSFMPSQQQEINDVITFSSKIVFVGIEEYLRLVGRAPEEKPRKLIIIMDNGETEEVDLRHFEGAFYAFKPTLFRGSSNIP